MTELSSPVIRDCCVYIFARKNIKRFEGDSIRFDVDVDHFKYLYVGLTNGFKKRLECHLSCVRNLEYKVSSKFYNPVRAHGWEDYEKIVVASGLTREEAIAKEIETIAEYRSFELGLNSTPGGECMYGADHPNAQAVNLYNNKTGEIISFLWMKDADAYLGVVDRVKNVSNPNGDSQQVWSPIYKAWFQAKKVSDNTPFIENMPTPDEKREESAKQRRLEIIVVNIDTRVEERFDWVGDAAEHFSILQVNIFKVINREDTIRQFNVKSGEYTGRYDAQYFPKTREWDFSILPKIEAQILSRSQAVIAFDEDGNLIYDFSSIDEAMESTGSPNVSGCVRHKIAFSGYTEDGQQIRWEYKDPQKRALFSHMPRTNVSNRIYFITPNGKEEIFRSKTEAIIKTRKSCGHSTQYNAITKSLLSDGKIACKDGKIWYRKTIVFDNFV